MGKDKARIKGNAQPADSSKAAQFLQQSGPIGFGSFASSPSSTSLGGFGTGEEYATMAPELKVLLKKLSKRDSTTKAKAVDEILVLLRGNSDVALIDSFLPLWESLFNKLALDVDRKVRENAMAVHLYFAQTAPKRLAPILKKIIGVWLLTRFDVSKEVSSLAIESFQAAFPHKQEQVLVVCQAEIIACISNNIMEQTVQSMSDSRYTTPEDMVSKYARTVAASFDSLAFVLDTVSAENRESQAEGYKSLFTDKQFWVHAGHEQPVIRSAVYRLIKLCVQKVPEAISLSVDLLAQYFLSKCFGEKDFECYSYMWDAVLLILKHYPDIWTKASEKKPVIKKLYLCLSEALYGSGKISYPCILPLIAYLPPSVCDQDFYSNFLNHFWKGVEKLDRFSGQIFINSYYECCKYQIKCCPDVKILLSKDFLRPIKTLLTGKLSKIPHAVVIAHFTLYLSQISKAVDPSVLKCFEDSLLDLLENSLESASSVSLLCSFLQQVWGESKGNSVSKTLLVNFLPKVFIKINEGTMEGDKLLITILSADLEYSDEVTSELSRLATKIIEEDSKNVSTEAIIQLLYIIQNSHQEHSRYLWSKLVDSILAKESSSFAPSFAKMISALKKNIPTTFVTPIAQLDTVLNEYLASSHPGGDVLLSSLMQFDIPIAIMNRTTIQVAADIIGNSLQTLADTILVVRNREALCFDSQACQQGLTSLLAIKLVLEEQKIPKNSMDAISGFFYQILQISICDPTSVTTFKWSSNSNSLNAAESFKTLREVSKAVVSLFSGKCGRDLPAALGSQWGQEFSKNFSNLDHCASPLDAIESVKALLMLSAAEDYQASIWIEIFQTPEYWKEMSIPYYSKHSPSMSIADTILIWTVLLPSSDNAQQKNIIYDHDGLSSYSRRSLLIMGLLKDPKVPPTTIEYWLTHELLRFKFVCSDSVFKEAPFPFLDDAVSHSSRIENDISDLLSRLSITEHSKLPSIISACQSNPPHFKSKVSSSLEFSFSRALEGSLDEAGTISDCRIFGYLVGKCAENFDSASLSSALLNLLRNKKYSLLSAFLLLRPLKFSVCGDLSKALIGNITESRPQNEWLSDEISSAVVLCHLFESLKGDLTGLVSDQERTALLRWVRTFYNTKVVDEPLNRNEDSEFSVMFDAIICNMIELILNDVNAQSVDIGLNMANFIANLCLFWFKQISVSILSQEMSCLLFRACKLWQELQEAADIDSDSWQRVIDVEDEVETLLLDLFITTSQPDMLSTVGFATLQELMADIVLEYTHSDFLRLLVSKESMIYNMFMTSNEQVQKTSYTLARTITLKRVEDVSVSLEMQSTEQTPVFLKAALVGGLQRGLGRSAEEQFGCLLSWLCLVNHFVDATFDLRQYYTNHIRELNVLGPFLESIFGLLNVDPRKGDTFNLEHWDFQEYLVEGFDSSSDTSIPLLCAHLYYRLLKSLPVLVRLWFSECKNRQLVLAVENFTEKYFSPLLVANEFKTVQKLVDQDMAIKINPKTYDISASYNFEEAELDILIKLPPCFPLKLVEVSSGSGGGRQAGISDARWRGWLLAVSSIMIGHNGSVADSLAQFKKNVSLHFEGIEDCAICYSVISLADRSTPQKACRVCKNVFHGSCLYKWFKSSSQNTCPLCRQPI